MEAELETLPEGATLDEIIHAFKNRDASYLHVVNHDGELTGIISFRDIRSVLDEEALMPLVVAKDVATPRVITVTPSDSIQLALKRMSEKGVSQLPVVSEENRHKLLGTLRHKDVMAAYDRAVLRREMEASSG
jgi:CIC family chloride channel protein